MRARDFPFRRVRALAESMKVAESQSLAEFVASLPRGRRQQFRKELADAHECSVSLVRKWECWPPPQDWTPKQIKSMARRHPAELSAIEITEHLTGNKVTRYSLRPECWSRES